MSTLLFQIDEAFAKNDNEDEMKMQVPYNLPADSESIRPNILDSQFRCDEREPGYYADVENECQVFNWKFDYIRKWWLFLKLIGLK